MDLFYDIIYPNPSPERDTVKLKCINIATADIIKMRDFYALVFNSEYNEIVPGRFEIPVGDIIIVITHTDIKTEVNPDCCGLEFGVDNVDDEYKRLIEAGVKIENPPVTYPWGWRTIGFKDPDGNNIDFVMYVG